jgi:hypothetical protein
LDLREMSEFVQEAGFRIERAEYFPRFVVMNGCVIGRKAG